jgi:hypothetical protein
MIAPLSINSSHADCRPARSFFLPEGEHERLLLARADEVIE